MVQPVQTYKIFQCTIYSSKTIVDSGGTAIVI